MMSIPIAPIVLMGLHAFHYTKILFCFYSCFHRWIRVCLLPVEFVPVYTVKVIADRVGNHKTPFLLLL